MKKLILLLLILSGPLCFISAFSQEDNIRQFDRKLESTVIPVTVLSANTPTIKLPKRKYDSPLFCNELIPWKDGYIINSLSIAPGGRTMDHNYRFFYFSTKTNKLETITTTLTDSIESIIVWNDALYLSGKKNGDCVIGKVDADGMHIIERGINNKDGELIGKDSWLKLGVYNNQLLALQRTGVYVYNNGQWQSIFGLPFHANYYKSKYPKKYPLLPTENIRVYNNTLYMLQEITQQRTADLYSLNLSRDSCADEFFTRNDLADNTKIEIVSYVVGANGLWVAALRLMQETLLLHQKDSSIHALVINNQATTEQKEKLNITPSCISQLTEDTMLVAGSDGLFILTNNHIKPLCKFMNTNQQLKLSFGKFDWEFVPRCAVRTKDNRILMGGLWGGLYLIDTNKNSMQCFDDLKNMPPNRDLLSICR